MTNFQMWILVVILVNYKVNLTLKKNLQQKKKKEKKAYETYNFKFLGFRV
jgi:hypothetical protein